MTKVDHLTIDSHLSSHFMVSDFPPTHICIVGKSSYIFHYFFFSLQGSETHFWTHDVINQVINARVQFFLPRTWNFHSIS